MPDQTLTNELKEILKSDFGMEPDDKTAFQIARDLEAFFDLLIKHGQTYEK